MDSELWEQTLVGCELDSIDTPPPPQKKRKYGRNMEKHFERDTARLNISF